MEISLIKTLFYLISYYSGLVALTDFLFYKILKRKHIPVVVYHTIINDVANHPFLSHLGLCVTKATFKAQLRYLQDRYTVIPLRDYFAALDAFNSFKKHPLLITFDDGYLSNYTYAYPLLRQYDVPATIFLCTDYIDTGKAFWWDVVDHLAGQKERHVKLLNGRSFDLSLSGDQAHFFSYIMSLSEKEKEALLDLLDIETRAEILQLFVCRMLSTKDICEMEDVCVDFGSHSNRHLKMKALPICLQEKEIRCSLDNVERLTGKFPVSFAYPYGHRESFSSDTERLLRNTGVTLAVVNWRGRNNKFTNPLRIKRIIAQEGPHFVFKFRISALQLIIDDLRTGIGVIKHKMLTGRSWLGKAVRGSGK